MTTPSFVFDCCSRRDLGFKPILVGFLFSPRYPSSSLAENGVDLAPESTEGAGVVDDDLLRGCPAIIGDPFSSGISLNRTVLFPAFWECFFLTSAGWMYGVASFVINYIFFLRILFYFTIFQNLGAVLHL